MQPLRAQGSRNTDGLLQNSQNVPVSLHKEVAASKIFLREKGKGEHKGLEAILA